jgi:hypothetical protein
VLFEAKTVTPENAHKQIRSAIVQLLEYRHFHHHPEDTLCVVTNGAIPQRSVELLRSLGIDGIQLDGDRFVVAGSPLSPTLSQVPD